MELTLTCDMVLRSNHTLRTPWASLKLMEFQNGTQYVHLGLRMFTYQLRHQPCAHLTVEKTEAQRTTDTCVRLSSMSVGQQGLLAPIPPSIISLFLALETLAGLVGWAQRYQWLSVSP